MNKYDLSSLSEDKIGTTWQFPHMQPIAVAHGEDKPADDHLRAHVLGANARHVLRSFFPGQRIDHKALYSPQGREQRALIRDVFLHRLEHDGGDGYLRLFGEPTMFLHNSGKYVTNTRGCAP